MSIIKGNPVEICGAPERLTQVFANGVHLSLPDCALSVQTDFDRSTGQMVATYATV
jgi:hypothetical protein